MKAIDRLAAGIERVISHPVTVNAVMIICSVVLGLVFATWLAGWQWR